MLSSQNSLDLLLGSANAWRHPLTCQSVPGSPYTLQVIHCTAGSQLVEISEEENTILAREYFIYIVESDKNVQK